MTTIEEEMRQEMYKLEKEIAEIDSELEKLNNKMISLMVVRKKKDHDLRILKTNFGLEEPEGDIQTTLARILKERYMKV